ncbi:hypothetical protein [Lignipirellula cremea]|uniref:Uncharacterized protein n=1 Tax=Lignipirellula cremea TaxID=2528010 RepID=A0A518DYA9_9BACT|nr:hypothetical protein [Lignipirellula cremea]QDU96830.1 hypothetical protein Pla8534_46520 [Lignipirellula cremea]
MSRRVVPADLKLKRIANWTLAASALAGVGMVFGLRWYLGQQLELAQTNLDLAIANALWLVRAFALAAGLGLLAGAAWWGRMAWRIRSTRQFPPPGARVLADTPIRRGPHAMQLAWNAGLLAGVLLLTGTLGMLALERTFSNVLLSDRQANSRLPSLPTDIGDNAKTVKSPKV